MFLLEQMGKEVVTTLICSTTWDMLIFFKKDLIKMQKH